MSIRHRVTESVATELDTMISALGSDQGISESTSVRVLKDAIVVTSILRVSNDKHEELAEILDSVIKPMFDNPTSNNVRMTKVEIPEYLGSLNT